MLWLLLIIGVVLLVIGYVRPHRGLVTAGWVLVAVAGVLLLIILSLFASGVPLTAIGHGLAIP